MVEVEATIGDGGDVGAHDMIEDFAGISDGVSILVGVHIDEEGEDDATGGEGESNVSALSSIETVEVVPLVGRDQPVTAVYGSQVTGLALGSDEGCEEGV